jgi:hypothetical protein
MTVEEYVGKKGKMSCDIPGTNLFRGDDVLVLDAGSEGEKLLGKTLLFVRSLARGGEAKWVNKSDVIIEE